ncbi:FN3 associated domain-containing protein [Chitinophaga sedimenti]|uniref:FN3 associated domain-containing protein n=1 Tax=Chitinophaga sedimenti TaxID=2033606 RepID=UPI00249DB9C4|nr:FN3 associated domain-containing protein [Chitinophaga sedimenti]
MDVPVSAITEHLIVPVPYVTATSDRFKTAMPVILTAPEAGSTIYYTLDGSQPTNASKKYSAPIAVTQSCTLKTVAYKNGQYSQVTENEFHRIPTDKNITILSKIHPQYTGGGNDALIDGIRGKSDFRLGGWQSHYPGNLEAIVDLKAPRKVNKISLSVLQDLAVWIWYPTQVEFFSSADGKNFTSLGVVKNTFSDKEYGSHLQVLSLPVNLSTRYIKVVAQNHGIIPDWHPGKGEAGHIFADEIIIE